ncbi:MAG: class I SAM-dependent methyltransferase, partial [Deltaproteobacteria bacterium]|nr:class I SAM-dependent methyltransferase [Deltaproteobacteria bacterium]
MSAYRPCTLCGAEDPTVLYVCDEDFVSRLVYEGHRHAYTMVRCRRCELVYIGETVTDELLDEVYSAGYYQGRDGDGFHDYSAEEAKYRPRFAGRIERMAPWVEEGRSSVRVLDVGCALGWFVAEANKHGWAAEGVDKSPYCREFAKEKLGATVHTGSLADLDVPSPGYDLVTLWDTIEHLQEPREMMRLA